MKQEASKNKKKWLLPVIIAAAALVVVGVVLGIFLLQGGQGSEAASGTTLYWNVDRLANLEEESGMSTREPGSDGMYAIRFAVDGEQVEFKATDKRLVNAIDMMDVMGLIFDDQGLIVDIIDPKTEYVELARDYFVVSFTGSTLEINSSMAMNGMPMVLEIPETAGVYDVRPEAEVVGQPCTEMEAMDSVLVYTDMDNVVTHVFLTARMETAEIYHRVDRFYDKAVGTTRVPDENGVFTIPFAYKGQQVQLKCKDKDVVTMIDSKYYANVQMGLLFDEEGYIIKTIPAPQAMRGKLLYSAYSVTEISGSTISLESVLARNKDIGTTGTMELPEDCEIYLVENGCEAEFVGQAVPELKIRDIINVYTDLNDVPKMVFIERRFMESPLYYNVTAKYSSTTLETTRKPDENGWYVFDMVGDGKELTLKTKDKAIATRIDSSSTKFVGLRLSGNVIEAVCTATCVCGGSSLTNRFVTENMGSIVRVVSRSDFTSGSNRMMAADCKVYDISGDYGIPMGTVTTVQKGDLVTAYLNESDELCYIFVIQRYYEGTKLYYNYGRTYDSTKKETKRTPDENGYYVFEMACEGKQVTVKTKNKAMASWMDKQSPAWMALKVSGGIVKEAHKAESAIPYGRKVMNGVYVDKVQPDGSFTYLTSAGKEGNSSAYVVGKDTSIYNVSAVFNNNRGEKTKLQKNDRIYPIINCETKNFHTILVTGGREVDPPLYYKKDRQYNFTTKETTREPDAEGWYVYEVVAKGKSKIVRTKDRKIATDMDARSGVFGLRLDGDVIKQVYTYTYVKDLEETKVGNGYIITAINGNKITLTDLRATSETKGNSITVPLSKNCEIYDVSSYSEPFGAVATLGIGDKVSYYGNKEGVALYVYITAKNTRKAGLTSVCEHCDKEVTWTPFTGTTERADTHYYLPADATYSQLTIGWKASQLAANPNRVQYETILDLNGFTLTGKTRAFLVYGTLSVLDSAGGGVVQGNTGSALQLSSSGDAVFNLYGGTVKPGANIAETIDRGGTFHGSACTVNIYGGTIVGGTANRGGVAYLNNAKLNIHGGTIQGGAAVDGGGGAFYLLDTQVNMTGGTVIAGTASGSGDGIYLHKSKTFSTMTMSGGTLTGSGDVLYTGTDAKLTVTGGKIEADVQITKTAQATFSGTPVISGQLNVPADSRIHVGKLKQGASIRVFSDGVFTTETENMAQYQGYFKPARPLDVIAVAEGGKELTYTRFAPDGNNFDNSDLVFDAGTNLAVCPACGDKVAWTPVTQQAYATTPVGAMSAGSHYYLAENVTYTGEGSFAAAPGGGGNTACFHLNGKNITSTASAAFFGNSGTLNIMGEGVVAGYNGTATTGSAVGINTSGSQGTVNLYGGTYTTYENSVAYTIGLNDNGGTINLFKAVTVNGNSRNRYIRVGTAEKSNAVLGIYGATVNGRISVNAPDSETYTNTVLLENATVVGAVNNAGVTEMVVTGGTIQGDVTYSGANTMTFNGAKIQGNLNITGTGKTILAGKTIVEKGKLNIPTGKLVTLGELVIGANITVEAEGVFTAENDQAANYAQYFHPVRPLDIIGLTDNQKALTYTKYVVDGNNFDNSDLVFDEGTNLAACPACGDKVEWTAIAQAGHETAAVGELADGGHYYLAENVTYTGTDTFVNGPDEGRACLHLNGKELTTTQAVSIRGGDGTLNVMGNGKAAGYHNTGNYGGTLYINSEVAGATLNVYGGTYDITDDCVGHTVSLYNKGGTINLYKAVTIDGNSRGRFIRVGSAANADTFLNVYGAKVNGRVRIAKPSAKASNVLFENVTVGGDLINEGSGNVTLNNVTLKGNLNLEAGNTTLTGNTTLAEGKTMTVTAGALVTLGDIAEGVVIPTTATGVFTVANDNAAAYLNRFAAAVNGDSIQLTSDNKALEYVKWNGNLADNSKLVFDEGTTDAVCPVCHEKVTWTALTATTEKLEGHLYLPDNVTYAGNKYSNTAACLHLNGFKVESTSSRPIQASAGGTLNVMGNGTVKGAGSGYNPGAAAAWGGTLNLYGGTYQGSTSRVLGMSSGGGSIISIYAGAIVEGNVIIRGAETTPSTLNIYGGTFSGTISCCGYGGTVNVTGGNFTGVKLLYEESNIAGTTNVNISGGTFAFTQWYAAQQDAGDLIPVITGGTYVMDPAQYVPAGFTVQTNPDATFTVVPAPAANP